jgi:hypothetical protein
MSGFGATADRGSWGRDQADRWYLEGGVHLVDLAVELLHPRPWNEEFEASTQGGGREVGGGVPASGGSPE